jgi:hypothetical protein
LPLRPVIFSLTERKPEAKQAFIEQTCISRMRLPQAHPSIRMLLRVVFERIMVA